MSTTTISMLPLTPLITRRVRAYFAPVNRSGGQPTIFDPAQNGDFDLDAPAAPWIDLGWLNSFQRKSGTQVVALRSGAPGLPQSQVRTEVDSIVSMRFSSWGKLQMALTAGSEQMNLLAPQTGATLNGSGGNAAAAVPLQSGSTATFLSIASNALVGFTAGQMVAVDIDYTGQTGYVGSGVSGAYIGNTTTFHPDVNYVRRITFNVARVSTVLANGLELAQPLIAGVPTAGMSVQPILGFVDREGSNFFHEWSGLFVIAGEQGDRVILHYPRLQIAASANESLDPLPEPLPETHIFSGLSQAAEFRALPVTDSNDGAQVLCFRSYIPAACTRLW